MSEKIAILPTKSMVEALILAGDVWVLMQDWKEDKCEICGKAVLYYVEKPKEYKKVCIECATEHYPSEAAKIMKRVLRNEADKMRYIQ